MKIIKKCTIVGMALCVGVTLYAYNSPSDHASAKAVMNNNQSSSYSQSLTKLTNSLDNIVNISRMAYGNSGFALNTNSSYLSQNQLNGTNNLRWNYSQSNSNQATGLNQSGISTTGTLNNQSGINNFQNTTSLSTANSNGIRPFSNLSVQMEVLSANAQDLRNTLTARNIDLSQVQNIDGYCRILDTASNNINAMLGLSTLGQTSTSQTSTSQQVSTANQSNNLNTTNPNNKAIMLTGTNQNNVSDATSGYLNNNYNGANRLANRLLFASVRVSNEAINNIRSTLASTPALLNETNSTTTSNVSSSATTNTSNTTGLNGLTQSRAQNTNSRRLNGSNLTNPRNPQTSGNYVDKLNISSNRSAISYNA